VKAPADRDPALAALLTQIARDRGFGCHAYKESCLRRRLAVRMRACGVHTFDAYARVLAANVGEYDRLLDALTINVTKFYRNRETWDVLRARVLPELWRRREGAVRAWSAGCATGEEPYTLAMLLRELARRAPAAGTPTIDATDVDPTVLARAAEGRYPADTVDEMPPDLVTAGCVVDGATRLVRDDVRALVTFRRHDLLQDAPPAPPYDLIICRNVIIYFDRQSQDALFNRFTDALTPGGVLVLGKVETMFGATRERLTLEDTRERIYRRR
jgi:chemotaxis methyl-accepting protein methylase